MRYVILSPPYRHNSSGIRVLYELQKYLIRIGEDAIVINIPIALDKSDVLVLPEIISNESGHDKVVRWYLNKAVPNRNYDKNELNFKFNQEDHETAIPFSIIDIEYFFTDWKLERQFKAVYVGKGEFVQMPEVEGAYCITGDWPPFRRDVADLLNRCTDLYMYDDKSCLAFEAKKCGTKVHLYKDGKFIDEYPFKLDENEPSNEEKVKYFNYEVKQRFFGGNDV